MRYFALRATVAGAVTGGLAGATFAELSASSPYVFHRLTGISLPLVAVSIAAGIAVLGLLWLRWYHPLILRATAAVAVATVVWGWGLAQYPYLFPTSLALGPGSAPTATLDAEFVVAGLAVVLVVPGFALLYYLQQRGLLTEAESDADLRLAADLGSARPGAARPRPLPRSRSGPGSGWRRCWSRWRSGRSGTCSRRGRGGGSDGRFGHQDDRNAIHLRPDWPNGRVTAVPPATRSGPRLTGQSRPGPFGVKIFWVLITGRPAVAKGAFRVPLPPGVFHGTGSTARDGGIAGSPSGGRWRRGSGSPALADPRRHRLAQLMVVLDATVVNIALPERPARPGLLQRRPAVGRDRLLAGLRQPAAARRAAGRPGRPQADVHHRPGRLRRRLGARRRLARTSRCWSSRGRSRARSARCSRPAALSLLTTTFTDPAERGKAFGVYGAIAGAGGAIGLLLGGVLTEYLSWRWCLYVNLVFAVDRRRGRGPAAAAETAATPSVQLDMPGTVLVAAGLFASSTGSRTPRPTAGARR